MNYLAIDYENFYSDEVTIKTLGTHNYTRHPETRPYLLSAAASTGETFVGSPDDFDFSAVTGPDWQIVHHNASYDSMVYQRLHEEDPATFPLPANIPLCTADMSAYLGSPRSLAAASSFLLGVDVSKDTRNKMKGKRWEDMTPEFQEEVKQYAMRDAELCLELWQKFNHLWPAHERQLSRHTARMAAYGVAVDRDYLLEGKARMEAALDECRADIPWGEPLLSKPQFDAACAALGLPAPKSLAKTSEEFAAWLEKYGEEHKFARAVSRYRKVNTMLSRIEAMLARCRWVEDHWRMDYSLMYYGALTGRWCLTGNAEVLTKTGWVQLQKWDGVAEMLQFDPETRNLSWCENPKLHRFDTGGRVFRVRTRYIDFTVTPEHRFVFAKKSGSLSVDTAQNLSSRNNVQIPVSGVFGGPEENSVLSQDEIRLLVATQADGCHQNGEKYCGWRWAFAKDRKIDRLDALLRRLKIQFNRNTYSDRTSFTVTDKNAPWYLSKELNIGMLLRCSGSVLDAFLDELPFWDGSSDKNGSQEYCSTSKSNVEAVVTVCHIRGRRSLFREKKRVHSGWNPLYRCTIFSAGHPKVRRNEWGVAYMDKRVYCPETDTGAFLCRYNGKIFVSGNSGGGGSLNMQNLRKDEIEGFEVRKAIVAPPGKKLIVSDLSNIEPRVGGHVTKDEVFLEKLRGSGDIYEAYARAAMRYSDPMPLKEYDKVNKTNLRQLSKAVVLGCAYGAGGAKFKSIAKTMAGLELTETEAQSLVEEFRASNPKITRTWRMLDNALKRAVGKPRFEIELPSGRIIPHFEPKAGADRNVSVLVSRLGKFMRVKLWGSNAYETTIQAAARDIFAEGILRVEGLPGCRIVAHTHDEVISETEEHVTVSAVEEAMCVPPAWAPTLPLAAEGAEMQRYSK